MGMAVSNGFRERARRLALLHATGVTQASPPLALETSCMDGDAGHRGAMSSKAESPPPDANGLYQAALTHLARFATTEAGLRRVLTRQVDRWALTQTDRDSVAPMIAAAREAVEEVIGRLKQAGAVSDTAFAESRAKNLVRGGQSNRAVQARLIAKGVAPEVARAASVSDPETELAAALVLVRKRRIGPYRATEDAGEAAHRKELGVLARAGFARDLATQALNMSRDEAESRIFNLRR
jgi:regulatory protein